MDYAERLKEVEDGAKRNEVHFRLSNHRPVASTSSGLQSWLSDVINLGLPICMSLYYVDWVTVSLG